VRRDPWLRVASARVERRDGHIVGAASRVESPLSRTEEVLMQIAAFRTWQEKGSIE
jgi:DNA-binding FrmR family transcriptional regulator